MSTVMVAPAEVGNSWARKIHSWARAEDAAFEALQQARESGDAQLAERARRTHAETFHRSPTGQRPRRKRDL